MLTSDKIIEIFVKVDDFCKEFESEISKHQLDAGNYKVRDRKASLSDSEIITILIAFTYEVTIKNYFILKSDNVTALNPLLSVPSISNFIQM